jgi:Glycosyl hydrolases family 2, sugar binding domain
LLLRYDRPCKTYFILAKSGVVHLREQAVPLATDWYRNPDVFRFDCQALDRHDVAYYKFNSPPGFHAMEFSAYGTMRARAAGVEMRVRLTGTDEDGLGHYAAAVHEPNIDSVPIVIAITGAIGAYGGAAIPEPIRLTCGIGEIGLGDWSRIDGLRSYSGGAWYRKAFRMPQFTDSTCLLSLGCVASSAEVHVNGRYVGEVSAPPWKVDVADFIRQGDNQLEILVCNTMANYYSTIPTRYGGELASGLIGPVALETTTKLDARVDGEDIQ